MKLPISALVVTCNEEHLLKECLESISFCDEIVTVDLHSEDKSVELAKSFGAKVFIHDRLPSSEYFRPIFVPILKHDWVLIIDPDEVVTQQLQQQIIDEFDIFSNSNEVSHVSVPWVFYFKKHQLRGTPWGGNNRKTLIANRLRFTFVPRVHNGQIPLPGFRNYTLGSLEDSAYLVHKWMLSWRQFHQKHLRYLRAEGQARFSTGDETSATKILLTPVLEFYRSFFKAKGYRDGLLGFALSTYWSWYQTMAKYRLLQYSVSQSRLKKTQINS